MCPVYPTPGFSFATHLICPLAVYLPSPHGDATLSGRQNLNSTRESSPGLSLSCLQALQNMECHEEIKIYRTLFKEPLVPCTLSQWQHSQVERTEAIGPLGPEFKSQLRHSPDLSRLLSISESLFLHLWEMIICRIRDHVNNISRFRLFIK